jgi:hypothetical protein
LQACNKQIIYIYHLLDSLHLPSQNDRQTILVIQEIVMASEEERTGTWHAYGRTVSSKPLSLLERDPFLAPDSLAFFKPVSLGGSTRFAGYLAIRFPEVVAAMDEEDLGVLHLEVGALKIATRDAILRRDWTTVRDHFLFLDQILEVAEAELHDAIGISYLVNLFFNETSINFAKARTLMPRRLSIALEIMERHYEELM